MCNYDFCTRVNINYTCCYICDQKCQFLEIIQYNTLIECMWLCMIEIIVLYYIGIRRNKASEIYIRIIIH